MNTNPKTMMNNKKINRRCVIHAEVVSVLILLLSGYLTIHGSNWRFPEREVIKEIDDKTTLLEIVKNHTNILVRMFAADKIDDQSLFMVIAKNENEDHKMRGSMIYNIKNQAVIADLALNAKDWRVRASAANNLNDLTLLAEIEKNDKHRDVRGTAADRPKLMHWQERKKLEENANFSALAQTNDIPPLSEAALYYLQEQKLLAIVETNGTQKIDNDEKLTTVNNDNQPTKTEVEITFQNSVINQNFSKFKLLLITLGLGSVFIISFFILRAGKNLSTTPPPKKPLS